MLGVAGVLGGLGGLGGEKTAVVPPEACAAGGASVAVLVGTGLVGTGLVGTALVGTGLAGAVAGVAAGGVGVDEYAAMAAGAVRPPGSPTAASTTARADDVRQRDMTTPND